MRTQHRGLLLSLTCLVGSASAGAAMPAPAPAAPAITLQHVALDLRLDTAARQAMGTATLSLLPRQPVREVAFDAAHLAIESVLLNGRRPLRWVYDGAAREQGLRVLLDRPLPAGRALQLRITYRSTWVNHSDPNNLWGSNGLGLRFHEPSSTEPRRRRQVWASGEPGAHRYWFPSLGDPTMLRTSSLRATVPAPLTVVAGGRLTEVRDNADGTRTFHWVTTTPEPNHRTSIVVGEFSDHRQRAGRVQLHSLGHPEEARAVAASVVQLPDTLQFLQRLTARAFPHPHYSQAFVQDLPWNTVATGLAVNTENMVDDAGTHLDYQYLWDGLQTESLAQQWFGGQVPVCDWRHVWLEKAMAHHLAALYTEHRHGRDEYLLWYVLADQAATLADAAGGVHQPVVDLETADIPGFVAGNAPYLRGAAVLHGLRMAVGEAAWRAVIRHYLRHRSGQPSCTEHLRQSVQAVTGHRMDWFFAQWVYRAGHPVFTVQHRWDALARQLRLQVSQVAAGSGSLAGAATRPPRYFQGPVAIEIDQRVHRVWLAPTADNHFVFPLAQAPGHVHFDHGEAWIKQLNHPRTPAELLHQLSHSRDGAARQSAMLALVQRGLSAEGLPPEERQRLQQALVDLATGIGHSMPAYWRLRMTALQQLGRLLAPAKAEAPAWIDATTTAHLVALADDPQAWVRTAALRVLGSSRDPQHAPRYLRALRDSSDRVVNAAAIALGQSGSPQALDALLALPDRPSWKNQSLISALNGLKALGDARGIPLALDALQQLHAAHWTLATPIWDFRLAAAETLAALGGADKAAPAVLARLAQALAGGQVNDAFSNGLLLVTLNDPLAEQGLAQLRQHFANDANALKAVEGLAQQWAQQRQSR